MKSKSWWVAFGMVGLLALAGMGLGCARGEAAEDTGDTAEATEQASEAGDDTGDASDKGEDAEAASVDEAGDDENVEEAVPVEVAALETGEIEAVLRFSSNLEAEDQVEVHSQAARLVVELFVEEGDDVDRGQVLLRLQDDEQRSQLAKVRSQLAKEEREFKRQQRLYEQELISEQVFADAQFAFEQMKISVNDAERELGYTEVTAPIRGTVTQRLVKVGDQIQIGQHLFDLVDFDSIVARIYVPEKYLPSLRPGLAARVAATATGDREHVGTVDRVSPIVDPQSGTVKVTIALSGKSGLRPGLYVDVDLITATHPEAVLIPKRALVYDSDQMFVFRLDEDRRVEQVFIEPLLSDKSFVEPLEGVFAGDLLVIAGQTGLKDKTLVELPGDADDDDEADASADNEEMTKTAQRASS